MPFNVVDGVELLDETVDLDNLVPVDHNLFDLSLRSLYGDNLLHNGLDLEDLLLDNRNFDYFLPYDLDDLVDLDDQWSDHLEFNYLRHVHNLLHQLFYLIDLGNLVSDGDYLLNNVGNLLNLGDYGLNWDNLLCEYLDLFDNFLDVGDFTLNLLNLLVDHDLLD